MAHRKTGAGGRGGEHIEVTDNFASLVFGDPRKPPEYGRVFPELLPHDFYACTQTTSGESNRATGNRQTVKRHILSMSELLQKHIRTCLSRTFFYGSDVEEEKLRETLARHAQRWEEDEVDRPAAAAGVKKALAPRSEVTALNRMEAT